MEELAGKLGELLNSPEGMKQVQELAGMLGLGNAAAAPTAAPPAPAQSNALAGLAGLSPDMIAAMARLAPLLASMRQDDDTTRLLQALRPLLSEERRERVDRAVQMVRLLHLLPKLQESGLLSSLFHF